MKLKEKMGIKKRILQILFIILLVIGVTAIIFFSVIPYMKFGAESNPTGNPLGGGEGYRQVYAENDVRVKYVAYTKDEFLSALERAKAGDVIYIPESANIDLTGALGITIPGGVTIAGNRGTSGSPGGRIFHSIRGNP